MLLDGKRASDVFLKVRETLEEIQQVCLAPDRPALPVEELQGIISKLHGGLPIEKYLVPYEATEFCGMIEKYSDKIVVYVRGTLEDLEDTENKKFVRFVATKELCHALVDKDADESSDGVRTIRYLLEEYRVLKNVNADEAAQCEVLAEIAAIELMYPYEQRLKDKEKVESGQLSHKDISDFYEIPTFIVERVFEDWFHQLAITVWALVEQGELEVC